ncbi:MAG: DNA methyltransferase [Candidatus Kapaibacteriales bacterium]
MEKNYKENKEDFIIVSEASTIKDQLDFDQKWKSIPSQQGIGKVTVYIGDVYKVLRLLPDSLVDCVVTSPPYWKQRDYKDPKQIGQEPTYQEYIDKLVEIFDEMKRVLKPTGTFFLNVGYKYQNKELLLIPELLAIELQKNGWTLLNKIIWYKPNAMPSSLESRFSNVYEPVFLFVKTQSKYKYYLSIDSLRIPTRNFTNNKEPEDFLGLDVENPLFKDKKIQGFVSNVYKNSKGELIIQVEWEDGKKSLELANDFDKESQISIDLLCPVCGKIIKHEVDLEKHTNCKGFPIPILPPKPNFNDLIKLNAPSLFPSKTFQSNQREYKGKFKFNPENRGASPGARKSLFGEYLVLQRRYKIFQSIIANYLGFWRKKKNISIKEIDNLFGYKHTAGHWFRKDSGSWGKGGSIPLPDDWFKLKEILEFDDIYDRWVTETQLVIQTVKPHPKGKNPGDLWSIKLQPLAQAHFATFPEELVKRCIQSGCPMGGLVLDPFAGSGTTGKVAQELQRNSILIELVSEYLSIINNRCKNIKDVIYVK